MNVHLQGNLLMTEPVLRAVDEATSERRTRILDAAERSFARTGFHRTGTAHPYHPYQAPPPPYPALPENACPARGSP